MRKDLFKRIRILMSLCLVLSMAFSIGVHVQAATTVRIYYGNNFGDKIIYKDTQISALSAQELIKQLNVYQLAPNTTVKSFKQTTLDGKKVLQLDLSTGYFDALRRMGTAGEYIMIGSLVNTFLMAYSAERINVTINGSSFETGHVEYEGYMGFYKNH
jgi:hypothetical protein